MENDLNFEGLAFPIRPKDIHSFEIKNSISIISINLFGFLDKEGKLRFAYYISSFKYEKQINLIYFENHYAWIRDFDKLMCDINKGHYKKLFGKKCFSHFRLDSSIETHHKNCAPYGEFKQIVRMPPEGSTLTFENIQNRIPCPCMIFADFESILTPINKAAGEHTVKIKEHHHCSVGVRVLSCKPSFTLPYASILGIMQ